MAPIPVRQPKGAKPLPLQSTLGDLSSLRAQNIDLSILLDQPTNQSANEEPDKVLKQSHDYVKTIRRALDTDADVTAQGDRVETVRAMLQEIEIGIS